MLVGIITFLECLRLLRCDNVTVEKLLIIYYARQKEIWDRRITAEYLRSESGFSTKSGKKTQTNNAVADVEVVAISCKQEDADGVYLWVCPASLRSFWLFYNSL